MKAAVYYGAGDIRVEERPEPIRAEDKIETAAVITHRVPLEKILDGIELMKKQESLKVPIYPSIPRKRL